MADPSERISQLKIDRSAPAAAVVWWFFFSPGSAAVLVETVIARRPPSAASANSVLDASGYVVARRQATVSSKITGKVVEVLVEEGMRVEKDQVVARLDDTTQQAQLSLAKAQTESARAALDEIEAQLRFARLERDRFRDLAGRNLTS